MAKYSVGTWMAVLGLSCWLGACGGADDKPGAANSTTAESTTANNTSQAGGSDAGRTVSADATSTVVTTPVSGAVRTDPNHLYDVPGFFTLLLGMLMLLGMVWLLDRRTRHADHHHRSSYREDAAGRPADVTSESATETAPDSATESITTGTGGQPADGPTVQTAGGSIHVESERGADINERAGGMAAGLGAAGLAAGAAATASPSGSTASASTPTASTRPASSRSALTPATQASNGQASERTTDRDGNANSAGTRDRNDNTRPSTRASGSTGDAASAESTSTGSKLSGTTALGTTSSSTLSSASTGSETASATDTTPHSSSASSGAVSEPDGRTRDAASDRVGTETGASSKANPSTNQSDSVHPKSDNSVPAAGPGASTEPGAVTPAGVITETSVGNASVPARTSQGMAGQSTGNTGTGQSTSGPASIGAAAAGVVGLSGASLAGDDTPGAAAGSHGTGSSATNPKKSDAVHSLAGSSAVDSSDAGSSDRNAGVRSTVSSGRNGKDDLTRIKGIGMKTSRLLNRHGIRTYQSVAESTPESLQEVLGDAGPMFASNNPETWPEQAALAMRGEWAKISDGYGSNGMRLAATGPLGQAAADSDESRGSFVASPQSVGHVSSPGSPRIGGTVRDDLTRIVGIGPKASQLLRSAGIGSFEILAATDEPRLKQVLEAGGSRFALLDPSDWAAQARLAADAKWDDLAAMQHQLGSNLAEKSGATSESAGDNLTRVEGIGPKIAEVLEDAGIESFALLAQTPVERLQQILSDAGSRFALADPGTWPEQAALAADGRWAELGRLQDELDGGKRT